MNFSNRQLGNGLAVFVRQPLSGSPPTLAA